MERWEGRAFRVYTGPDYSEPPTLTAFRRFVLERALSLVLFMGSRGFAMGWGFVCRPVLLRRWYEKALGGAGR